LNKLLKRTDIRLAIGAFAAISVLFCLYALQFFVMEVELERLDSQSELERHRIEEAVKRMQPVPEESKKFGPKYPGK
jgi:hypothetical protein